MDLFGWGSFCLSCLVFTNFETRSPSLGKDAKSADAEATQRDDNLWVPSDEQRWSHVIKTLT